MKAGCRSRLHPGVRIPGKALLGCGNCAGSSILNRWSRQSACPKIPFLQEIISLLAKSLYDEVKWCHLLYLYEIIMLMLRFIESYYPILDTRIFIRTSDFVRHAQGTPPWILKRDGLESSGRRLISSNGKTKRITFLSSFSTTFFWLQLIIWYFFEVYPDFQIFWQFFIICWFLGILWIFWDWKKALREAIPRTNLFLFGFFLREGGYHQKKNFSINFFVVVCVGTFFMKEGGGGLIPNFWMNFSAWI